MIVTVIRTDKRVRAREARHLSICFYGFAASALHAAAVSLASYSAALGRSLRFVFSSLAVTWLSPFNMQADGKISRPSCPSRFSHNALAQIDLDLP